MQPVGADTSTDNRNAAEMVDVASTTYLTTDLTFGASSDQTLSVYLNSEHRGMTMRASQCVGGVDELGCLEDGETKPYWQTSVPDDDNAPSGGSVDGFYWGQ